MNNFISIYITLIVAYNLKSFIYVELQNWSEAIQLRLLHCCVALNIIMSTQNNLLLHATLQVTNDRIK
jgi:hypothetical protein